MPYHVLTIHFRDVVGRPMKRRLVVGCGSRLSLFRPAPLAVLLAVGRFFPLVSPLRHLPQVSLSAAVCTTTDHLGHLVNCPVPGTCSHRRIGSSIRTQTIRPLQELPVSSLLVPGCSSSIRPTKASDLHRIRPRSTSSYALNRGRTRGLLSGGTALPPQKRRYRQPLSPAIRGTQQGGHSGTKKGDH